MGWAGSLTRIANYEVETLQKRVAEIAGRKLDAELRMTLLDAEAEAEAENARTDREAAMFHPRFVQGWRARKADLQAKITAIAVEESGARDALTRAFEELKKYEHVVEMAAVASRREAGRREAAAMDEMGLRRAGMR
ncbi:MAG: flagellar export protein FliJ [Proteobacteria bacterium]|nr:flagellar export protein FliJ [Pseudomonadota bacterium]